MQDSPPGDVTALLANIRNGQADALPQLVERIYDEFHRLATAQVPGNGAFPSLQPTMVLHEAFAKLLQCDLFRRAPNRAYLFASAARAMRHCIIEHIRKRKAQKRAANGQRIALDDLADYYEKQTPDMEALSEALDRLEKDHPRAYLVVMFRFFGGFTMKELARQLEVSLSTAEAEFRFARAWLRQQLGGALS